MDLCVHRSVSFNNFNNHPLFFRSHRRPSLKQSIHRNIHANNEFLLHHVTGRFKERMSAYFRTHSTGVACARTGNNAAAAATWVDYAHHTSSAAAALCTQPLRLHQQLIKFHFLLGKRKLHLKKLTCSDNKQIIKQADSLLNTTFCCTTEFDRNVVDINKVR